MEILDVRAKRNETTKSTRTKIHFFLIGENIIDNLTNRHSRPYTEFKKHLPEVFKKAGIDLNAKYRWSQKAGCSCGCSPGFVVEDYQRKFVAVDYKY